MALYAETIRIAPHPTGLEMLHALFSNVTVAMNRFRTRRALAKLSDAQLSDIGLTRRAVVEGYF